MNDAQQPYAAYDESAAEISANPTPKKTASFVVSGARSKQIWVVLQTIGGVSAAVFMALWFAWKMISPNLTRAHQAEVFQPDWLDSEATQQATKPSQSTLPLPEPNTSLQAAEEVAELTPQKPAEIPLLNELTQINARLEVLEEHSTALKLALQQLIASALNSQTRQAKQSLAERSIAPPHRVRQTRHMPQMNQRHHPTQLHRAKQAAPKHNMAAGKQSNETNQQLAKPMAQPALQLKAVLQGRAWLQTQNGASITVSVGERVPGMGIVKVIDPEQGKVIFSNGVVLR